MDTQFFERIVTHKQRVLVNKMRGLAQDLSIAATQLEKIPDLMAYAKQAHGTITVNSLGVVQSQGSAIDNAIGELCGYVNGINDIKEATS